MDIGTKDRVKGKELQFESIEKEKEKKRWGCLRQSEYPNTGIRFHIHLCPLFFQSGALIRVLHVFMVLRVSLSSSGLLKTGVGNRG